jgi:FMN reductase
LSNPIDITDIIYYMNKKSVTILGSPFPSSSSEKIARDIQSKMNELEWETSVIDLSGLPANDLLMRSSTPSLEYKQSIEKIQASKLIIIASPTYRATYTGLLKTFLDTLPQDSFNNKYSLLIQTGGSPEHSLSLEHGLIPLARSLGSKIISNTIYSHPIHWNFNKDMTPELSILINKAITEIQEVF